jgi:putative SOS response-associated peptidase YedK
MPEILTDHDEQDAWLNPDTPLDRLQTLLRPYDGNAVRARKVGRAVSEVRNYSP